MSNYHNHAMTEFRAAGFIREDGEWSDGMQQMICNHILKLLEVFSEEGHSGSSAPYAINMFSKLAKFEPIVPLTGEDWEWADVSEYFDGSKVYQNRRCGAVFKDAKRFNGKPYYLDAKVFWSWYKGEDGKPFKSFYTSSGSAQEIQFPYTPKTEYVFEPTEEYPNETLIPRERYRG